MKIFCLERDNTTYQSNDDKNGNSYRASFELFPFREGKDFAVYKGMLNGMGPKRGVFCAVKALVTKSGSEFDWHSLIHNSETANTMAEMFNEFTKRSAISFTEPLVAQMNKVSDFNGIAKIFAPHEKRLKQHEYVIIEEFIDGRFERFSSASGATASPEADMTSAFTHFTWHHTREYVICGLQGVKKNGHFELTSPTIHSLSGQFGPNDCRYPGILEFFYHHQCNNICCGLDSPLRKPHASTLPATRNSTRNSNHGSNLSMGPTTHAATLPTGAFSHDAIHSMGDAMDACNLDDILPMGASNYDAILPPGANTNRQVNIDPTAPPPYYTY